MAGKYQEKAAEFEKKYGFEEGRVEKFFSSQRALRSISKYFLGTSYDKSAEQLYHEGLHAMLNQYAENCIKPEATINERSMDYTVVVSMMKDYEELMQVRHEELNPGQPRNAYEGDLIKVSEGVKGLLKDWDTKLVNAWADRIKNESYNLSDLRKITRKAYNEGKNYFVDFHRDTSDGMGQEYYAANLDFIDEDDQPSVGETVAMMRDAMEKVTQSRSTRWYLNPLNWWRAIQERLYMRELNRQVKGPKGNLDCATSRAEVRGDRGMINGDDRTKLYTYLTNTVKRLKLQEEIRENRRRKLEEEKNKQNEISKEEKIEGIDELNNNNNEILRNDESMQKGEKVEFKDEFTEKSGPKSPVVTNEEKHEKKIGDRIIF